MTITTRELTTADWPQIEALFGSNGACGGCWCMSWRIGKGEKWDAIKGDGAKARMKALVESGEALGILAFDGDQPIGWTTFGPRRSFAKLDRAPSLACDDADAVWSIPCFFVQRGYRGQGVSRAMLAAAQQAMAQRGVTTVEGYPAKPPADGTPLPAAFAWTGPRAVFDAAGFTVVGNPDGGKQRMRKALADPA
jgi:GNAT superfamily N-acetyltransferase